MNEGGIGKAVILRLVVSYVNCGASCWRRRPAIAAAGL